LKAVEDLNIRIHRGDIYGFLGQNGAGKTTTIRLLTGLVRPDAGVVELFGEKLAAGNRSLFRQIGAMIEYPGFYGNLTALENLDLFRRLYGLRDKRCMEEALHTVGLLEDRNRMVGPFSLGMKQRLGIARAIMHRPEFLILDEPTNGLDPVGIKEIRSLIQRLAHERRITVLVSSHILSEVQQLATRVGIIHRGKLLEELDIAQLEQNNRQYVEIRTDRTEEALAILRRDLRLESCSVAESGAIRVYERLEDAAAMNRALVTAGIEVGALHTTRDSLEDYFIRLIGGAA
jgi:bacitracin transport system ATP-binding protein